MNKNYITYCFILFALVIASCQKDRLVGEDEQPNVPDGDPEFVVASYNILHDTEDIPEQYKWAARKDKLIDQVKENNVSILCIQEDQANQATDIMKVTGLQVAGTSKRILYDGDRFIVKSQGRFYLSETPEKSSYGWDAAAIRLCNWVLFNDKNTGKSFFVFNAHFDHIGNVAREKSALLMKDRIGFMAKGQPVIMTGDMNAYPGSRPILTLTSFLQDSRVISQEAAKGPIGTFNGMDREREFTARIDYVFVSPHLKVKEYEVLQQEINGVFPSDHFPVITKLELK